MDSAAAIQLAREIDALKREIRELQAALDPIFKREADLQFKERMDKENPYGWGYIDPNDHSKGVWSG